MTLRRQSFLHPALRVFAAISLVAATAAAAQNAPILQPGAPGQPAKVLTPEQAIDLADMRYSPGDVAYMQHMILHHQQAIDMTALVAERTTDPDIRRIARRIEASQADEMKFMTDWLTNRGEPTAMPAMGKESFISDRKYLVQKY